MKLDKEMINLAAELIQRKARPFDPAQFKDHYANALKELIERKRQGQEIVAIGDEKPERRGNVIDLMQALKKSVAQDPQAGKPAAKTQTRKPAAPKRPTGDRKPSRRRASR